MHISAVAKAPHTSERVEIFAHEIVEICYEQYLDTKLVTESTIVSQ